MFRRFGLFLVVEAEPGTFFHKMAGTVELFVPFYMELWTVAVSPDEEAFVEFDTGIYFVLLAFWRFLFAE